MMSSFGAFFASLNLSFLIRFSCPLQLLKINVTAMNNIHIRSIILHFIGLNTLLFYYYLLFGFNITSFFCNFYRKNSIFHLCLYPVLVSAFRKLKLSLE